MTTPEGYRAAAQLIRGQAAQWDVQAPNLTTIAGQVQQMRFQGYTVLDLFKPVSEGQIRTR